MGEHLLVSDVMLQNSAIPPGNKRCSKNWLNSSARNVKYRFVRFGIVVLNVLCIILWTSKAIILPPNKSRSVGYIMLSSYKSIRIESNGLFKEQLIPINLFGLNQMGYSKNN